MSPFRPNPDEDESLSNNLDAAAAEFDLDLDDVVGLEGVKAKLRQTFYPAIQSGEPAVVGPVIAVRGPSGAGKRRLGRAIAGELQDDGFEGALVTEDQLQEMRSHPTPLADREFVAVLERLRDEAPSVLVLDRVDISYIDHSDVVASAVDDIRGNGDRVVCVIVREQQTHGRARRSPDSIPFADFALEVPEPGLERRALLLQTVVTAVIDESSFALDDDIDFEQLAQGTEGFRRDALDRVTTRAKQLAFGRDDSGTAITQGDIAEAIDQVTDEDPELGADQAHRHHLEQDVTELFARSDPDVGFDDVGGLEDTTARVRQILTYPDRFPELFEDAGFDAGHGLLFHGPPGTGKTLLAKAIAAESDRTFFAVKGPEVKDMYFGETERRIRELFAAAEEQAPSLVFFDEIDSLAGSRDGYRHGAMQSVVNTLLTELDGLEDRDDILVVGATNRRDALDEAVLRPGRFDEAVEFTPPGRSGRAEIFAIHSEGLPCEATVTPEWFAGIAPKGVTGAEIEQVCERAANYAMQAVEEGDRDRLQVRRGDIATAIEAVLGSSGSDRRGFY